jgi:urease accessory protein UreF
MAGKLKFRDLVVPAGLEFIIVARDVFTAQGFLEFHLQGLKDGQVTVHASMNLHYSMLDDADDPKLLCQKIIDDLHRRCLLD